MKVSHIVVAALAVSAPLTMNSCSVVSQIRSVDLAQFPGMDGISKAQEEMMQQYGESTRLLVQSRVASLEALELDATAYAESKKAGDEYKKAVKIASNAKKMMNDLNAQLTNLQNKPDLSAVNKAVEVSDDAQEIVQEGYASLSEMAGSANASIAAQNKKGDKMVMAAYNHVAGANNKIAESYGLLQNAQLAEGKLVVTAAAQSAELIKSMKGASSMQKAALAITFRPIVYFLTGLPDEFNTQDDIRNMWQEHAKQVDGLKLPSAVQMPSVKTAAVDAGKSLLKEITPSFGF